LVQFFRFRHSAESYTWFLTTPCHAAVFLVPEKPQHDRELRFSSETFFGSITAIEIFLKKSLRGEKAGGE
jgi:hypothetical protein